MSDSDTETFSQLVERVQAERGKLLGTYLAMPEEQPKTNWMARQVQKQIEFNKRFTPRGLFAYRCWRLIRDVAVYTAILSTFREWVPLWLRCFMWVVCCLDIIMCSGLDVFSSVLEFAEKHLFEGGGCYEGAQTNTDSANP